jgi:hypothetical protein
VDPFKGAFKGSVPNILNDQRTGAMDARNSSPASHIQQYHFRQLLGDFFCSLNCESPWWVSMVERIQNYNTTCLTHYLDFKHSIGVQFICSTGLLKVRNSRNSSSTVVIKVEWDVSLKNSNFLGL